MTHPFDLLDEADFRRYDCNKWTDQPDDVLPLWVADMDFPVAEPIRRALAERALEGALMYPPYTGLPGLHDAVTARLAERYGWRVDAEGVYGVSGIVPGLFLAVETLAGPGEEVIVQPPIYPPFMEAVEKTGRTLVHNPLGRDAGGWSLDLEGLEALVTPATRALMLCNPHNPTGRVLRRAELEAVADIALRHRLWVIADELHADLVLSGEHIPFASLGPEVAARTLTLYGPTKAFNIAGLKVGFAITENRALHERFRSLARGRSPAPNVLGQVAALAAYREGAPWLDSTLDYLRANRDALGATLRGCLPRVGFVPPEGTYLAWLDLSDYALDDPQGFLHEHARVRLASGAAYGPGGEGFVRLNFATSRSVLMASLGRIHQALSGLGA